MAKKKNSENVSDKRAAKTRKSKVVKTDSTRKTRSKATKKAKDWRAEIKVMLEQMKQDLLQDVAKSIKNESDYMRHDVGDFYDHASNDRDRELALMITDRERTKLVQIEDALKRIEDGEYGECENCQDEIGEDRLRAMPFAKFCLSCKIELERLGEI